MQLSDNFRLSEFLVSQTASRHGIDMSPSQDVITNIQRLVVDFLQPIRDEAGSPLVITSGYRPPALNSLIGGSPTSAHRFGRAADFRIVEMSSFEACELIERMDLKFDQLILEFPESPRSWVHLGIAEFPRRQVLTAKRENGKTVYVNGLQVD